MDELLGDQDVAGGGVVGIAVVEVGAEHPIVGAVAEPVEVDVGLESAVGRGVGGIGGDGKAGEADGLSCGEVG